MPEDNMAANTTEEVVEIATPNTDATTEPTSEVQAEQVQEVTPEPQQQDISQTQAFAHRLKEETAKSTQTTRDSVYAEMGYTWNDKPITNEREYKEAVKEQEIRESLANRELPEEVINELVESRKFREESKAEKAERTKQEAQQNDYRAFAENYPGVTEVPQEVWDDVNKGRSLVDAYRTHENKTLKAQIAEFERKAQIQTANSNNATSSTGSITGQGSVPSDFISKDTFESNRGNQSWMSKNYESLKKSMGKW